jgi:transcriptional regulator with XRE-family HTH domain
MEPERALRELGIRIRKARTAKKLSRRVLAELAGMHQNTLKAVEYGKGNPTYRVLLKLADVLGSTLVDLLRK